MTDDYPMNNALPPLVWFRAFEATARHLSFTVAAQELNVTQSAISQHVRALETRFGQSLFIRRARGLALTDAGRKLMPLAASALSELAKATELFLPDDGQTSVSVSCTTSFAQLWLAPRLVEFTAAHPDVTIQISSTLWPDDYLDRKTDVEIHFGRTAQLSAQSRLLLPVQFMPVCSPAISNRLIEPSELWQLPLIDTVGALYGWKRWARRLGYSKPPDPVFSVDSMILAQTMAEAGLGVALVSPHLCHEALSAGRIHALLDTSGVPEDCYYFTASANAALRPGVRIFCQWLESMASKDVM